MRPTTLPAVLLILSFALGCSKAPSSPRPDPAPSVRAASPTTSQPAVSGHVGMLMPADLQFVEVLSGTAFFSLQRDGVLRVGDRVVGQLSPAGTFTFGHTPGRVTATLSNIGRVEIVASDGTDLHQISGELGRLLRDYGGRVESGYTIQPDDTATIPLARPLSFDAEGRLSERGLMVQGLTPQTRRTAMFIYVLVSTVASPPS